MSLDSFSTLVLASFNSYDNILFILACICCIICVIQLLALQIAYLDSIMQDQPQFVECEICSAFSKRRQWLEP